MQKYDSLYNQLNTFARGEKPASSSSDKNAVIYTRVSSKEQSENLSLDVQLNAILQFTQREGYSVISTFGGTYESAKSDERKEFKKMLEFVRRNKKKISHIIVYSLDRFSRTGGNAIYLSDQLREEGVQVISVTQPMDSFTPSGELHQSMMHIFSKFDNSLRRQKTIAGMRERLQRGHWTGITPTGYRYDHSQKEKPLVQSEQAPLIKRAFYMKAIDKMSNADILRRLKPEGLNVNQKSLSKIFSNPTYCGYLSNALLEGEIVLGKHKPIISKEIFLRANENKKEISSRIRQTEVHPKFPLKNFILCSSCGHRHLTGYEVKKKGLCYYKCSHKACCHNINADKMHKLFLDMLAGFTIRKDLIPILKQKLKELYKDLNSAQTDEVKHLKSQIKHYRNKIEKLEERYALGDLEEKIFKRVRQKQNNELVAVEKMLFKMEPKGKSDVDQYISFALLMARGLDKIWQKGEALEKRRIQQMVFPKGIIYTSLTRSCVPVTINPIVEMIQKLE